MSLTTEEKNTQRPVTTTYPNKWLYALVQWILILVIYNKGFRTGEDQ
jgi:hypothetical protein